MRRSRLRQIKKGEKTEEEEVLKGTETSEDDLVKVNDLSSATMRSTDTAIGLIGL